METGVQPGTRNYGQRSQDYHPSCNRNEFQIMNTLSQASDCQRQDCGSAYCRTLPHLNSPFKPSKGVHTKVPAQSPNTTTQTCTTSKMPYSPYPITKDQPPYVQYTTPAFVLNGENSTLPSNTGMSMSIRPSMASRMSTTPQLSHSASPNSVFSSPYNIFDAQYNNCGWDTPATTTSNIDGVQNNAEEYCMPPFDSSKHVRDNDTFDAAFDPDLYFGLDNKSSSWLHEADVVERYCSQGNNLVGEKREQLQVPVLASDSLNDTANHDGDITNTKLISRPESAFVQKSQCQSDPVLGQRYFQDVSEVYGTGGMTFDACVSTDYPVDHGNSQLLYNDSLSFPMTEINETMYPVYCLPFLLSNPTLSSNNTHTRNVSCQEHRPGPVRNRQTGRDEDLDKKLVAWRNSGMSYKDIQIKGNFGLEESTLRGRYRTLTKAKDKRLRKPVWDDHAVTALLEAVEHHAPSGSRSSQGTESLDKIPWKKVAEWMQSERGCYLYGNATVKKKYVEVIKSRRFSRRQTTT